MKFSEGNLDPLGLEEPTEHPELDPQTYGFSEKDMDREVFINYVLGLETATVREIISVLQETYCGSIGVEFTHIQDPDEKAWIQERIERIHNQSNFTDRGKQAILNRLIETEGFEKYLDKKFTGTKRFGLDGGDDPWRQSHTLPVKRCGEEGRGTSRRRRRASRAAWPRASRCPR